MHLRHTLLPVVSALLVGLSFDTRSSESIAAEMEAKVLLEGFKAKLMEVAFEKGAVVKGLSYIDEKGALHQSTLYRAKQSVNGTQIQTFIDEMRAGADQSWGSVGIADVCGVWSMANSAPLPRSVSLSINSPGNRTEGASLRHVIAPIEELVANSMQAALIERGMRVVRASESELMDVSASQYQKVLLRAPSGHSADYRVSVSVAISPNSWGSRMYQGARRSFSGGLSELFNQQLRPTPPKYEYTIEIVFSDVIRSTDFVRQQVYLASTPTVSYESGEVAVDTNLTSKLRRTLAEIDRALDASQCLPRVFHVKNYGQDEFQVQGGREDGVNEGDWLLVGQRELLIDGQLNSINFESLYLARVKSVKSGVAVAELLSPPASKTLLKDKGVAGDIFATLL